MNVPKRILMVSPEAAPWASAGGLGDVVGALPQALTALGHDVRVVIPKYGFMQVKDDWIPHPMLVSLGKGVCQKAHAWETHFADSETSLYCLEFSEYFGSGDIYVGPYGALPNQKERFAFLSRASLDLCYMLNWIPDVIHCHDWTTGLIPVYLNTVDRNDALKTAATVFTIHNLQHQGIFDRDLLEFAGIPASEFRPDSLESFGSVNLMKGGIYHATKVTTVSPTYAREIQTSDYGCGLESILRFKAADLIGILNGIDTMVWNPTCDRCIPHAFSKDAMGGKKLCKKSLQGHFGLAQDEAIPLFGVVSRLYDQKGIDLLIECFPKLLKENALQLVLLGAGDSLLEQQLVELAQQHPKSIGVHIGYDAALSHQIFAGSDFFVMPSRFEPCGLTQMYAMAYGTPPIVRATGGLNDTVVPLKQLSDVSNEATGIVFTEPTADALSEAMLQAYDCYCRDQATYHRLQQNGMSKDVSWNGAAQRYDDVYGWAIDARRKGVS